MNGICQHLDLSLGVNLYEPVIVEAKKNLTVAPQKELILVEGAIDRDDYIEIFVESDDEFKLLRKTERLELTAIFRKSGMTKAAFLNELHETLPELEGDPAIRLPELEEVTETYETRDRSKYANPLDYLRKRWGIYQDAGILFQRDLRHLDPKLVPAVRSYCQRMAQAHPERAAEFVANDHLPPGNKQRTPSISETVPGTPAHQMALRAAKDRERNARKRKSALTPEP